MLRYKSVPLFAADNLLWPNRNYLYLLLRLVRSNNELSFSIILAAHYGTPTERLAPRTRTGPDQQRINLQLLPGYMDVMKTKWVPISQSTQLKFVIHRTEPQRTDAAQQRPETRQPTSDDDDQPNCL